MNVKTGMIKTVALLGFGYIVSNVIEAMYAMASTTIAGIGILLLVAPVRVPAWLRWVGAGMLLSSDWVQGLITEGTLWIQSMIKSSDPADAVSEDTADEF